jgi:hypothetical protein
MSLSSPTLAKSHEWSSFRRYATGCAGREEIESEWTTRKRERSVCPRFSPLTSMWINKIAIHLECLLLLRYLSWEIAVLA